MATSPDMAQQQQHDGDTPAKCKGCDSPSMPGLPDEDWCFSCYSTLFTSAGQASATEQLMQFFPNPPADPEPTLQEYDRHRQAIGADRARLKQDISRWKMGTTAFMQKTEAVKREAAALKQKEDTMKREWAALKQKEQELKRREANIQAAQQQVFAHFNQTPRAQPPLNMQAIGASGIMTQPYAYLGTNINSNLVGTKYNPPAHNAHLASGGQRIPPELRAGFKGHPMTRTDSYSPLQRHAVSLTETQIRESIEQQNVAALAMTGVAPRMNVAGSTPPTQAVKRDESAMSRMQEAQRAKMIQELHHSRHGSASSSNALGIFTDGSTESTPASSFVGAFSSPRPNKASPAHILSPPRAPSQTGSAKQLAALHDQQTHELAVQNQNSGYADPAIRLPQKSGTGRLLCPDCGTDKPIVKKRNDGIHCTSCFNKRNKAGEKLQTIEQRGDIIQVQRTAPVAVALPQPNAAGGNLPRSENIAFGHPSASDKPLYERELAQRRAEKEAAAGLQAQNASCTPQSALMRFLHPSSHTSSPLPAGQYHARQPIAEPGLVPQEFPARAASSTPKRNHEEAFGVNEHGMVDSPMSQPSPLQSNKKSKRSPQQQHSAAAPQYSAPQATEAPASKSNSIPLEFESSSSMGENTAQLSNLQDQHTTMYPPCPTTPGPAQGYADASNFYMSGGRRGGSPTLEEFEASLRIELLLENARMDKEKAEKEGVAEPKAQ